MSSTTLKSLYYALIHPYFLYCLPVISCSSPKNINMLALNKSGVFVLFVRLVTMLILEASVSFIKNSTSCWSYFTTELNFMPSIEYCSALSSFIDNKTFPKNSQIEVHPYPLRNINDFFTPRVRNEFLARFPFYSFPVWSYFSVNKQYELF